jgi:hypothetical protein
VFAVPTMMHMVGVSASRRRGGNFERDGDGDLLDGDFVDGACLCVCACADDGALGGSGRGGNGRRRRGNSRGSGADSRRSRGVSCGSRTDSGSSGVNRSNRSSRGGRSHSRRSRHRRRGTNSRGREATTTHRGRSGRVGRLSLLRRIRSDRKLCIAQRDTTTKRVRGRSDRALEAQCRDNGRRGQDRNDCRRGLRVTWLEGRSILGTSLDGHVSAEAFHGTGAVFGGNFIGNLELAFCGLVFGLDGEDGAVFDLARGVGACVDGLLKEVDVPAGDEVTVVAVA